jgi:hypothetical protein
MLATSTDASLKPKIKAIKLLAQPEREKFAEFALAHRKR